MFWIASKLFYAWNWIADSVEGRWWMWKHRHCSTDELLQCAIDELEQAPAGSVIHEVHQIMTEVKRERLAAAPSVEQKGSEK